LNSIPTPESVNFNVLHPEPLLIVISGPSGIGKDAVVKELQKRDLPLHFVITATSRPPRKEETHGVDYFFVSKEEFEEMIAQDELIEYAWVYNQYKGVPKEQVRQAMRSGKDVLMRLDVQGAQKIRGMCPQAVLIFLIPSDTQEWYDRLMARNTETSEDFSLRIETAKRELDFLPVFDYIVVNAHNCLQQAVDTIEDIIKAEHHRVNPRKITL
jgi:guanylate kinase